MFQDRKQIKQHRLCESKSENQPSAIEFWWQGWRLDVVGIYNSKIWTSGDRKEYWLIFCNREDYKHAYMNVRPIVAKSIPAWEDEEAYKSYIDECGSEASKNESKVNWYTYVAQKPLN